MIARKSLAAGCLFLAVSAAHATEQEYVAKKPPVPPALAERGWRDAGGHDATPRDGEMLLVLSGGRILRNARAPNLVAALPERFVGKPSDAEEIAPDAGFSVLAQLGYLAEPVSRGPVAVTQLASPTEPKGVILPPDDPVDDRYLVGDSQTLIRYPARTIGTLSGSPGGTGCTGVLVGPRHVLTAAHCLHKNGNWPEPIYFTPGQRGTDHPNGEPRLMEARYARAGTSAFDYGLVILEDEARTASLGWMGMGWYDPTSNYDGKTVFNHGYPLANQQCAASPNADGTCGGFMYADICNIDDAPDNTIRYDCDTQDGHSGGPVWMYWGDSPVVLAPHKGPVANLNRGTRLRPSVWNDVCDWMREWPSQFASHAICS